MSDNDKEAERKLLELLDLPEIEPEIEEFSAEDAIAQAFPGMDEKARKIMASVMAAEMQTPEEIERDVKLAAHNAEVESKRQAELERRAAKKINRRK